jgi:hypothetical protein
MLSEPSTTAPIIPLYGALDAAPEVEKTQVLRALLRDDTSNDRADDEAQRPTWRWLDPSNGRLNAANAAKADGLEAYAGLEAAAREGPYRVGVVQERAASHHAPLFAGAIVAGVVAGTVRVKVR